MAGGSNPSRRAQWQVAQLAEQGTVNPYAIINSMKICSSCGELKNLDAFNKKGGERRQPYCKPCDNKKSRERYSKNRESHSKIVYARNKKERKELQRLVTEIKEATPCADCGKSFPGYVMDFDHVKEGKTANISVLVNQCARQKLIKEIEKCEVVCSNCHRVRTFTRKTTL